MFKSFEIDKIHIPFKNIKEDDKNERERKAIRQFEQSRIKKRCSEENNREYCKNL